MIQREEHPPSEDVAAAEVIQVRTKVTDLSISCHTEREKDNAIASSDGSDCTASPLPPAASPDDSHLRLAMVLAAQGRHQEALQALAQELAANPTHVDALSLQGTCLAAMGNWAQAVAAFASALAANPSDVRSLLGYAGLLKDGGQLEEAIVLLERAQEEVASFLDGASDDENSPTSGSQQGTAATAELEALGAQVSHALAMSLTDLGTRLKLSGKNTWRERYDAALRACPSYAPAHYNLGVAAAEAGDAKVALQRYTKAVQLEPRYVEAWCNMGIIHKNEVSLAVKHNLISTLPSCMGAIVAGALFMSRKYFIRIYGFISRCRVDFPKPSQPTNVPSQPPQLTSSWSPTWPRHSPSRAQRSKQVATLLPGSKPTSAPSPCAPNTLKPCTTSG